MNNNSVTELKNRDLDNCLISIYIITTKIYFKQNNDYIVEKELYSFFSCNISGKRKFIVSVFKDDFNKTSLWYDFILSLKNKGIKMILYAVIPNNEYLSKAFKLAFNNIIIFISYLEIVTKLSKYYTDSYSKSIFEKVKSIYIAKDITQYELCLAEFKDEYLNFSYIYDIIQDDLKRTKQYYNYSFELRNFIFSCYFCREVYKKLLVISHSQNYFSSIDEFISLFLPYIQRFESRMFCTKNDLNNFINILYSEKKELIISYL